jgi:hypothetical protein
LSIYVSVIERPSAFGSFTINKFDFGVGTLMHIEHIVMAAPRHKNLIYEFVPIVAITEVSHIDYDFTLRKAVPNSLWILPITSV